MVSSKKSEPRSAFGDPCGYLEGFVQIMRLLPQTSGFVVRAALVHEYRIAANGVGEIKRPRVVVTAIDRECLNVAGFGECRSSRVVVSITEVPNAMRQSQPVVASSGPADGKLVSEHVSEIADRGQPDSPFTAVTECSVKECCGPPSRSCLTIIGLDRHTISRRMTAVEPSSRSRQVPTPDHVMRRQALVRLHHFAAKRAVTRRSTQLAARRDGSLARQPGGMKRFQRINCIGTVSVPIPLEKT